LERHDGGGEESVETLVPLGVGAEAGRDLMGDDFEDSAERVSGLENFVDFFFHALLDVGVGAVQENLFFVVERANFLPRDLIGQREGAGGDHVAEDFDAKFAKKEFGDGSDGDAGGGFAGGGALEDVAGLEEVVLQSSGEIGVAGAWRGDALVLGGISLADGERFLPVFPVAIFEQDGDGRADSQSMANAGENVGGVALDLHASAAAVALLAAPEITVEESLVYF
jgi:hypothetical protein